jgi:FkbM family methyltransferase
MYVAISAIKCRYNLKIKYGSDYYMKLKSYSPFKYLFLKGRGISKFAILRLFFAELIAYIHLIDIDWYYHLIQHITKKDFSVLINGLRFYCRSNTTDILHVLPSHERKVRKYLTLHQGVFIDVGAHIGYHALRIAKTADHVYMFEPTPETYGILLKNIRLNNFNNVTVFNLALSNEVGKTKLYINELNAGENSLKARTNEKHILVRTQTLDNIIAKHNIDPQQIKLLKVDVEGSESQVFRGASQFLAKFNPRIIFEARDNNALFACQSVLHELGYKIVSISDGANYLAFKT